MSRSRETTRFALISSIASSARCFGPPIGSATPSTRTVSGPRIRNSRRLVGICVREKCPPCGGSTQSRRTVLGQVWDIAPRRSAHAPNARNSSKATNTVDFSPRGHASRRSADPESVRRSWSDSRVLSATRDRATGPCATDQYALGRLRRHSKSGRVSRLCKQPGFSLVSAAIDRTAQSPSGLALAEQLATRKGWSKSGRRPTVLTLSCRPIRRGSSSYPYQPAPSSCPSVSLLETQSQRKSQRATRPLRSRSTM